MTVSNFRASKNAIMVVDDDPDLVSIVGTVLKGEGYI